MTVLVTAASKHGSTDEIAAEIARVLRDRGLDVELAPIEAVRELGGYDAFVIGSAVYMGRWLEPARDFVELHGAKLCGRPTWLFSSGPVGNPPRPEPDDAIDVSHLRTAVEAIDHRVFCGRIQHHLLGLGERLMLRAVGAAEGDYRDWAAIDAWAAEIADALMPAQQTRGAAEATPLSR